MRYERKDGTFFVLNDHTNEEWAKVMAARLRELGCDLKWIDAFVTKRYLEVV